MLSFCEINFFTIIERLFFYSAVALNADTVFLKAKLNPVFLLSSLSRIKIGV